LATVVVGGLLIGPLMLLVVVPPLRLFFLGTPQAGDTAASQGGSAANPEHRPG
jgi:heavy metal efflux system protein